MKLIIAGANGFIGSFLYNNLKNNYPITSLGYNQESFKDDYIALDLTDRDKVTTFVDKLPTFDVLIFLVGLAHKKGKGKELDDFSRINKQTLTNLISSLDRRNKLPSKIIFASTISVPLYQIYPVPSLTVQVMSVDISFSH